MKTISLLVILTFSGFVLGQSYIHLVIDASGSMFEALPSGEGKIDAAKRVLADFIGGLPETGLNVGLRIYGSTTLALDAGACTDSQLVIDIEGLDKSELLTVTQAIEPRGGTPIAYSLEQALLDFEGVPDGQKTVVLVTDGDESCGGDLASVLGRFSDGSGIELRIIGFGLSDRAAETFEGISSSFENVFDADSLAAALAAATESPAQDQEPAAEEPDVPPDGTWVGSLSSPALGAGQTTLVLTLDENGNPGGTWQILLEDGTVLAGSVTGGSITDNTIILELDRDTNGCSWQVVAQQDGGSLSGNYSRTFNSRVCDASGTWELTKTQVQDVFDFEGAWVGSLSSPALGAGQTTLVLTVDDEGNPGGTWQTLFEDGTVLSGSVTGGSISGNTVVMSLDRDTNGCTWRLVAQQDGGSLSGNYSRTFNSRVCDASGTWELTKTQVQDVFDFEGAWVGSLSSPALGAGQTTLVLTVDDEGNPGGTWQTLFEDGTVLSGSVTGGSITSNTIVISLDSNSNGCTWRLVAQQDGGSLSGNYSRTFNSRVCDASGTWDLTRQ